MKYLSQALLQKLNEKWQVESTDSKPALKIVATQSTANTLLGETIHGGATSAFGDIAIRELVDESQPSRAYAVCIDGGIAKVYERHFPADWDNPWKYVFTLGAAKDVGIEFNGNWVLDASSQYYVLKTNETPYLFWVGSDDILYCQERDGISTKLILDTNVSGISVCRGWQNSLIAGLDQGLVVAYLKAGKVYYRALCYQATGEVIWEPTFEVTELGTGNNSVSVFRTNDFRVGIVVENEGQMKWTLSQRNYAGMSVRPEVVLSGVADVNCSLKDINVIDTQNGEVDAIEVGSEGLWFLQFPTTAPTLAVTSIEKVNEDARWASGFKLLLNQPISGIPLGYASSIVINPAMTITNVTYDSVSQAIIILVAVNFMRNIDVSISIPESRGASYQKYPGQKHPLEALSGIVHQEVITINGFDRSETISASVLTSVAIANAVFRSGYGLETIVASIQGVTATLSKVSNLPI